MEEHLMGFIKDLEVLNYSPSSIRRYRPCIELFLRYLERKKVKGLRSVGREVLTAYYLNLRKNPKYSLSSVAVNIRAIHVFFKYLKKMNVVFYDFSAFIKEPKIPRQLPKEPLTLEEVKAMLEGPDLRTELGVRDRAILETFYSSGIRAKEMTFLKLTDLDLEKGYLFIQEGKGKKDRTVPLGKHACFFIKTYLEAVRPLLAQNSRSKLDYLWLNHKGGHFVECDVIRTVRMIRLKVGLQKQITPHSFRRTLAVELIRNECDFLSVKEILGHSRNETTLRYCALSGVDLKEAVEKCHPRYGVIPDDATPRIKSFS